MRKYLEWEIFSVGKKKKIEKKLIKTAGKHGIKIILKTEFDAQWKLFSWKNP